MTDIYNIDDFRKEPENKQKELLESVFGKHELLDLIYNLPDEEEGK